MKNFEGNEGKIRRAMDDIQRSTCVRFVPSNQVSQSDAYISIFGDPRGCISEVGKTRLYPNTLVNLDPNGCMSHGHIVHELLHALGFWHEQSRSDRDKYVEILWDNIKEEEKKNFRIQPNARLFGTPYDYGSIMHYGLSEFSKDPQNKQTIRPKRPYSGVIGQIDGLSDWDRIRINKMFNCQGLIEAAKSGHTDFIETLINAGTDLSIKNEDGATALIEATRSGHVEAVWLLITAGADVDIQTIDGSTALTVAADRNDISIGRLLIAKGARSELRNSKAESALYIAQKRGHVELGKLLAVQISRQHSSGTHMKSLMAHCPCSDNNNVKRDCYDDGSYDTFYCGAPGGHCACWMGDLFFTVDCHTDGTFDTFRCTATK